MVEDQSRSGLVGIFFGAYSPYIRRIKQLFVFCTLLFFYSLIMGYLIGETIPGSALDDLLGSFPDVSNMSALQIFGFIVLNNSSKSLLFMLGGILVGLPSLFFIIFNGFFIGWLSSVLTLNSGRGFVLAALMPHGIVEIPTIILSMAMGVSIGYELLNRIRGGGNLRREISLAIGLFINRIIPLIILAAVIEVTVTPLVLRILGFI